MENFHPLQASLQLILGQEQPFSKIIDEFPYPMEVFARDGTAVFVNQAMLAQFDLKDKGLVIGRYNIFQDPEVEKAGLMGLVREAFQGKNISVTDVSVPVKAIREYYKTENPNFSSIYQDVSAFPIWDEKGELSHVVLLFITKKAYKGKANMIKAVEYLENNWDKPYNLKEVAQAANLSPSHFSRLFKCEMGITPYNYYQKLKIERLMDKLSDSTVSVKEAFKACGLRYSGQSFTLFKKHVGLTPMQYREMKGK